HDGEGDEGDQRHQAELAFRRLADDGHHMPENRADVFHLGTPLDQGAPCWRHAGATNRTTIVHTSTHRRATSNRTRAAWQDSELAGISQQEYQTSATG